MTHHEIIHHCGCKKLYSLCGGQEKRDTLALILTASPCSECENEYPKVLNAIEWAEICYHRGRYAEARAAINATQ